MLQPTRLKYRKQHKGRNTGIATRGNTVSFGDFGLKAVGRGRLTARQIEAARRAMTRHIKRGGRIWIRVFPDKPITEKPIQVRMGGGKGNVEYYIAEIQPGKVLYEMDGVNETLVDLLKQQFGLRMQHATGQLGQTSEIKRVRRDIARVKTIISEKGTQS